MLSDLDSERDFGLHKRDEQLLGAPPIPVQREAQHQQ
jgi:hypothetical protein